MFKRMLLVCLLVLGLVIGVAGANSFDSVYDKNPDCFMSLDYTLYKGPAPDVWIVTSGNKMFERKYLRSAGDIWRSGSTYKEEIALCCAAGTVEPAWLCPAKVPATVSRVVIEAVPELEPKVFIVYFDFDSITITSEATETLEVAVSYAQEAGYSKILLASSCDFRGSDAYNIELGERRATAVEYWFIEQGITTDFFSVTNNGDRFSPLRFMKGIFCADCWSDRKVEITIE